VANTKKKAVKKAAKKPVAKRTYNRKQAQEHAVEAEQAQAADSYDNCKSNPQVEAYTGIGPGVDAWGEQSEKERFPPLSLASTPAFTFNGLSFSERLLFLIALEERGYISTALNSNRGLAYDYCENGPQYLCDLAGVRINHENKIVFPISEGHEEELVRNINEVRVEVGFGLSDAIWATPKTLSIAGNTYVLATKPNTETRAVFAKAW
jgi:hypothetical protein